MRQQWCSSERQSRSPSGPRHTQRGPRCSPCSICYPRVPWSHLQGSSFQKAAPPSGWSYISQPQGTWQAQGLELVWVMVKVRSHCGLQETQTATDTRYIGVKERRGVEMYSKEKMRIISANVCKYMSVFLFLCIYVYCIYKCDWNRRHESSWQESCKYCRVSFGQDNLSYGKRAVRKDKTKSGQ